MRITITAETDQEKELLKKDEVVHEGVNRVVIAGQCPLGPITFAVGGYFDTNAELHRIGKYLDTQFESQVFLERKAQELNMIAQAQQAAVVNAQVNGRGGLKLRN